MTPPPRQRLLRRIASACVLLMLVVTTASAWLRLAQPRPACDDWPHCRLAAEAGVMAPAAGPPALQAAARAAHRIAASAVLLLVLALLALATRSPRDPAVVAHALALLTLALALAALGIVTPRSQAASVLLGNLIGGLLMLALAWRLLRRLHPPAAPRPAPRVLAALTAAGWLLQAGSGAVSGAGLGVDASQAHLALALLTLPLAGATGWLALRRGRRGEGLALIAAAVLQPLLGAGAAVAGAAAPLVLLHNVTAAAGVALAAGLTVSLGPNRTRAS